MSLRPRFRGHAVWWLSQPAILLAGLLTCSIVGCSDRSGPPRVATYPVSTAITFQGKPIPGAFVALHPKSPQPDVPTPRANVGKDGKLEVTTYDGGDGAPAGEYVLTIEWYKPVKQGTDLVTGPNVIPRKYASPKTSDVVIRVAETPEEIAPIHLK